MFDQFAHVADQVSQFNPFQHVQDFGAQIGQHLNPQNWFSSLSSR
ncbi:hypothetical protein [Corynebacterium vitaeruminis]|nr:hypothetical protein [Corynebacterium vitaeruminis]